MVSNSDEKGERSTPTSETISKYDFTGLRGGLFRVLDLVQVYVHCQRVVDGRQVYDDDYLVRVPLRK